MVQFLFWLNTSKKFAPLCSCILDSHCNLNFENNSVSYCIPEKHIFHKVSNFKAFLTFFMSQVFVRFSFQFHFNFNFISKKQFCSPQHLILGFIGFLIFQKNIQKLIQATDFELFSNSTIIFEIFAFHQHKRPVKNVKQKVRETSCALPTLTVEALRTTLRTSWVSFLK